MTNDELLKSYMDQLARDQQNYRDDMRAIRDDMRAMRARMDAQQVRTEERVEALQARSDERVEALQARSDERVEALIRENRRDIRNTMWSGMAFATAIFGTIVGLLLAFAR